mmetsp:Transcript_10535/g.33678  ORF Transcript_10535/g.33678 Transcript_10535/m.33678 type:complete len:133 (-) Transcript_10535:323-721(-)
MDKFLELNPLVPRRSLFVDGADDFEAYRTAGFGKIGDFAPSSRGLKAPKLPGATWWKYLLNVNKLSPVPETLKFGEIPEGVLRLGGTFVIDRDTVLFAHADTFPGDTPAITDVLRAAGVSLVADAEAALFQA